MKTIDDYLKLPYKMEIIPDIAEGGFVVSFPDLPGCISCGETIEEAIYNAYDAKKVWIEAAIFSGVKICDLNEKNNINLL